MYILYHADQIIPSPEKNGFAKGSLLTVRTHSHDLSLVGLYLTYFLINKHFITSDAVDELRRLNDEAAQLEESDIIPEDPQINMTNREIDFQQMRLEDNFPMPLAMDAIDVSYIWF